MHLPPEHVPVEHEVIPFAQLPFPSHLGVTNVFPLHEGSPHVAVLGFGVSTQRRVPVEQSHTPAVHMLLPHAPPASQGVQLPLLQTIPLPQPMPLFCG